MTTSPIASPGGFRGVFDNLVRFETLLWNSVDQRLQADVSVTLGTVNVAQIVRATPACRVNDIAEQLNITIGGASQAVDRLVKSGTCVRRPHPSDRRSSIVALTEIGEKALDRALPVFDDELERWFGAALAPAELQAFVEALRRLRAVEQA